LAHATHAPILPVFVLRRDDDTFVLRFYPPIVPDGRKTRDELQQEICAVLEHVICENPSQWFVFERVWDGRNYGGCEAADSAALRAARAGRQTAVGA
jgi:lauroyl/myristoyl acyltransferase